ncbi:cell division protein FtsQ [Candidatus Magnetobacterium bavaricum]|uniref:Cell division protein FtsQ n=1 Tax=Candidatus Magnetobacterium bavaricum TaxID=29290 RepID=A0A0F3GMP8_9BACT|nr:cell division protein FtsQ [Candidatus Magnetobacterium bavaricum]
MNYTNKKILGRQQLFKKKNNKVMPLKLIVAIVAIILLTGCATAGIYVFIKADFLKVQHLHLQGNLHLKEADMLRLLNVSGKSLITMDCTHVSRGLFASAWVNNVMIRKEFPNTLFVQIKEKEPVGVLSEGSDTYLVDHSGQRLEKVEKPPLTLPVISVDMTNQKTYDDALRLTDALNKNSVTQGKNVLITGKNPQEIAIRINDTLVLLGSGDYEKKLKNYLQLKDEINSKDIPIEYIDMRFSQRLIVKQARRPS